MGTGEYFYATLLIVNQRKIDKNNWGKSKNKKSFFICLFLILGQKSLFKKLISFYSFAKFFDQYQPLIATAAQPITPPRNAPG